MRFLTWLLWHLFSRAQIDQSDSILIWLEDLLSSIAIAKVKVIHVIYTIVKKDLTTTDLKRNQFHMVCGFSLFLFHDSIFSDSLCVCVCLLNHAIDRNTVQRVYIRKLKAKRNKSEKKTSASSTYVLAFQLSNHFLIWSMVFSYGAVTFVLQSVVSDNDFSFSVCLFAFFGYYLRCKRKSCRISLVYRISGMWLSSIVWVCDGRFFFVLLLFAKLSVVRLWFRHFDWETFTVREFYFLNDVERFLPRMPRLLCVVVSINVAVVL